MKYKVKNTSTLSLSNTKLYADLLLSLVYFLYWVLSFSTDELRVVVPGTTREEEEEGEEH